MSIVKLNGQSTAASGCIAGWHHKKIQLLVLILTQITAIPWPCYPSSLQLWQAEMLLLNLYLTVNPVPYFS